MVLCTLAGSLLLFISGQGGAALFVLPLLVYAALTAYGSAYIGSQMFVQVQTRLGTGEKKICLSFDDGPHPNSLHIAEILKAHNIHAVFFCIGRQAEAYPAIVQKLHSEGHIIGNHTYTHSPLLNFFTSRRMRQEIEKTDRLIRDLTGRDCTWYRPPYGVTNHPLRRALKQLPHAVLGWNLRSLDTLRKDPEILLQQVLHKIQPGSILLFHDPLPQTAEMLRMLIPELEKRGYEFVLPEAAQFFVKPPAAH